MNIEVLSIEILSFLQGISDYVAWFLATLSDALNLFGI